MAGESERHRNLESLRAKIPELAAAISARRLTAETEGPRVSLTIQLKGIPPEASPPTRVEPSTEPFSLEEDVRLYPAFEAPIRKIYGRRRLQTGELESLVRHYQAAPEDHPRLLDNIIDALNPLIGKQLGRFTGTQESLRYHIGVKHLEETLLGPGREASSGLSTFLSDKENKTARHPNLGKSSLFFLIPRIVQCLTMTYPEKSKTSFIAFAKEHFLRLFMALTKSEDKSLHEGFGDRSFMGQWEKNQKSRKFLNRLAQRFALPAGDAGKAILIHETERLYDELYRTQWFPVLRHRGPIIAEHVLWDDILKPSLTEFANRYNEYNPPVPRETQNPDQAGVDRAMSFTAVIRKVLPPVVRARFNEILRTHRRGDPMKEAAAAYSAGKSSDCLEIIGVLLHRNDAAEYAKVISVLPPRTKEFWDAYIRMQAAVSKANPEKKRIQGLIYRAVAEAVDSTPHHARNKFYEVRRMLVDAGFAKSPKRRGRPAHVDPSHPPQKPQTLTAPPPEIRPEAAQ